MDNLIFSEMIDADSEFIPLLSTEEEELWAAEEIPDVLPILPLKNMVLFPGVVMPITVSRDKSIRLVREVYKKNRVIGVVSQRDAEVEDPEFDDLHRVGTFAHIIKTLQMPDGNTTVIIQGKKRLEMISLFASEPYFQAHVVSFDKKVKIKGYQRFKALISTIKDLAIQIVRLSPNVPSEAAFAIKNIESPVFLVNFISSNLNISNEQKQKLLETPDLTDRANLVLEHLTRELQVVELKNQIQSKVKVDIDKQQRDYILSQHLKTIQEELGGNPYDQQVSDLKERASKKQWSKQVQEVFTKEIQKLQRINPAAMEFSIQLNYLETLVDLPWNEYSKDKFDLKKAQKVLDRDHYGLEKVKERIIEHLAVLKLKGNFKSPILCIVGPPGVGKTSLGKSIAEALGRQYVRMSLGGLRDEAEIRGHRKTYVGAMPGRIIQNLKKAKTSNPVFVLDEIDKVGYQTFSGDPSSALLEVLDPEQNVAFYDNYLEVDYDLSKVMFIATANSLSNVQPALLDRMEVINLSGYIVEEKVEIARRHLLPKQLAEHGMQKEKLKFSRKVLEKIIDEYTRESGVRKLEKCISKVIRAKARDIVMLEAFKPDLDEADIEKIMGAPVYNRDLTRVQNQAGVMTGLAWTWAGGEVLYIEVSISKGDGRLSMTGNLGDVMKESATLAYEYLKAHASELEIDPRIFVKYNVHLHVPEGATPKDGPSAGITMFAALASAYTQRKVRPGVAMTGEITLRGKVLPVGGIKEKILAAKRSGIQTIILSDENRKDVAEINQMYLKGLDFVYIREMIEIVPLALETAKVSKPITWELQAVNSNA
ncbi:MAG TPA: endopeptidase La [Bacteroidales bacterium]|nr:endopeptidase La [Bacteroidales bacterium]